MQAAIKDRSGEDCVELLLVWSWRKIVSSRGNCPGIEREFTEWAGEAGRDMLLTYAAFLKALGHGSRRPLTIGHPGLLGFTRDERQVIALLAAAQAGDDTWLSAHLEWLIRADCQCTATIAARTFARLLADHGVKLALTEATPAEQRPARCPLVAVH
jgi:hypothetical protein